ncbi:sugar transferase [Desemzia incerta]|uniref:sugar transferase n=1 Tax=Desemzia incerta TaxID=82801 RepID=UPI003314C83B
MYKKHIKRLLDLIFATLLIPLITIIVIIIGVCIKIEDKGPTLYIADRLGKNGNIYKMYKVRSMKVNAPDIRNTDGSTFNSDSDPRLTKVGLFIRKTSLDELPQIYNVFLGNMSFIGPRPDLPEHKDYYTKEEIKKLEVSPGISGYNQAFYRNSTSWKERLKNDVYYVNHLSFTLDLKILMQTIKSVILKKGVFSDTK